MKRSFAIIAALSLAACSGGSDKAETAEQAEAEAPMLQASIYQAEVAPIFRTKCATCHLTGTEAGNLVMTPNGAVGSLVGVAAVGAEGKTRVVAGKPDESYLVMKIEGTHLDHGGAGVQMPFGAPPLSAAEIATIKRWITEGAKP